MCPARKPRCVLWLKFITMRILRRNWWRGSAVCWINVILTKLTTGCSQVCTVASVKQLYGSKCIQWRNFVLNFKLLSRSYLKWQWINYYDKNWCTCFSPGGRLNSLLIPRYSCSAKVTAKLQGRIQCRVYNKLKFFSTPFSNYTAA